MILIRWIPYFLCYAELDYPPKANAGSDIAIFLPQKSVILCGNSSTDDKGISSYEWIKSSDTLTADMTVVYFYTVALVEQVTSLKEFSYSRTFFTVSLFLMHIFIHYNEMLNIM